MHHRLAEGMEKGTIREPIYCKDQFVSHLFLVSEKSVLHPTQRIEFLGIIIDSVEMTVFLPREKAELIFKRCQDILSMQEVSIKDQLTLLGTLSSTALAILPAPLYMRYLQRQQIHKLCLKRDYNSKIALDPSARRN